MKSKSHFPLEDFSSPVRGAILDAFEGRCPTVQDVARIPDVCWLATPSIGPKTLEKIHRLTEDQPDFPSSPRITDAELLARLDLILSELRCVRDALKAKIVQAPKGRDHA